jgi:hypothetical protein
MTVNQFIEFGAVKQIDAFHRVEPAGDGAAIFPVDKS